MISPVLSQQADRPYVQTWLKRVGRQLRGSGRVSQVAVALSIQNGGSADTWCRQLREIIEGRLLPDAALITDIDRLLAKPGPKAPQAAMMQSELF